MDLGPSRIRSATLLLGFASLLVLSARWALDGSLEGPLDRSDDPFGSALTVGAAWSLVAACAWLTTVTTALLVEASTGRRTPAWCTAPVILRRLVVVSTGAALSVGIAAPAMSSQAAPPVAAPVDGLALPVRTVDTGTRQVQAGDSLWRIAGELAPGASPAEVATLVVELHRINHEVIGADPDFLRPGQQLVIPAALR